MLLGKTFSFTPGEQCDDETNVEDLAKACDLIINLFCKNPYLVVIYGVYKQNEKHPCFKYSFIYGPG